MYKRPFGIWEYERVANKDIKKKDALHCIVHVVKIFTKTNCYFSCCKGVNILYGVVSRNILGFDRY